MLLDYELNIAERTRLPHLFMFRRDGLAQRAPSLTPKEIILTTRALAVPRHRRSDDRRYPLSFFDTRLRRDEGLGLKGSLNKEQERLHADKLQWISDTRRPKRDVSRIGLH
jgi:hypothetical protein